MEPTIGAKWVEIIKQIKPDVRRIAIIFNADFSPTALLFSRAVQEAAKTFGIDSVESNVHNVTEITSSVETLAAKPGGALVLAPDAFVFSHRATIIELTLRLRLPSIFFNKAYASEGGLITYGIDPVEQFRQAASYADKILNGAYVGDLPVVQPTNFQLVVNQRTANALGLAIPQTLIATADEVIE
jgi:putative tryptophan/tyrosine transport system substrate-binding protein